MHRHPNNTTFYVGHCCSNIDYKDGTYDANNSLDDYPIQRASYTWTDYFSTNPSGNRNAQHHTVESKSEALKKQEWHIVACALVLVYSKEHMENLTPCKPFPKSGTTQGPLIRNGTENDDSHVDRGFRCTCCPSKASYFRLAGTDHFFEMNPFGLNQSLSLHSN